MEEIERKIPSKKIMFKKRTNTSKEMGKMFIILKKDASRFLEQLNLKNGETLKECNFILENDKITITNLKEYENVFERLSTTKSIEVVITKDKKGGTTVNNSETLILPPKNYEEYIERVVKEGIEKRLAKHIKIILGNNNQDLTKNINYVTQDAKCSSCNSSNLVGNLFVCPLCEKIFCESCSNQHDEPMIQFKQKCHRGLIDLYIPHNAKDSVRHTLTKATPIG